MNDTTPDLVALLPGAKVTTAYGVTTADVPREEWVAAVTAVRDAGGGDLDLLTAVDQSPAGFEVVARLWSVEQRWAVHLRTSCPRDDARVPTLLGVFAGAGWHEREIAEMYGVALDGHPDPAPLLLPPGGVRQPLRKEHVLDAREVSWPGSVDPADTGEGGRPSKRRLLPPGAS